MALDLDGCGIGDKGMELLRDLVLANQRIDELDLQLNQISDSGATALAEAVPNSGLSVVHLGNNTLTSLGTQALLEAAVLQHKLTGRMLKVCGISESVMAAARQQLQDKASAAASMQAQTPPLQGAQDAQAYDAMVVDKDDSAMVHAEPTAAARDSDAKDSDAMRVDDA